MFGTGRAIWKIWHWGTLAHLPVLACRDSADGKCSPILHRDEGETARPQGEWKCGRKTEKWTVTTSNSCYYGSLIHLFSLSEMDVLHMKRQKISRGIKGEIWGGRAEYSALRMYLERRYCSLSYILFGLQLKNSRCNQERKQQKNQEELEKDKEKRRCYRSKSRCWQKTKQ